MARTKRLVNPRGECFGTALYLAGLEDDPDFSTDEVGFSELLKGYEIKTSPVEGSIFVLLFPSRDREYFSFGRLEPLHAGFVKSVTPLEMDHRNGEQGPFIENDPIYEDRLSFEHGFQIRYVLV